MVKQQLLFLSNPSISQYRISLFQKLAIRSDLPTFMLGTNTIKLIRYDLRMEGCYARSYN